MPDRDPYRPDAASDGAKALSAVGDLQRQVDRLKRWTVCLSIPLAASLLHVMLYYWARTPDVNITPAALHITPPPVIDRAQLAPAGAATDWSLSYIPGASTLGNGSDCATKHALLMPPTDTRGCLLEREGDSETWNCDPWEVYVYGIHERAGLAQVRALMHYADQAGDPVCSISFLGDAQAIR